MLKSSLLVSVVSGLLLANSALAQNKFQLHSFTKQQLESEFHCEGATFGDLNRDSKPDIIAGPYWYEGPSFEKRHEYYKPHPFNKNRYSDNFFAFVHDFDADGWNDILIIGFPGKDASWFRNPQGAEGHWKRHIVFDVVDNESPTFEDITGDGKPELICQIGDRMGYATVDWQNPDKKWKFHGISDPKAKIGGKFTHGLGVGDVNGDGRKDILFRFGWWEQPATLQDDPLWPPHPFNFAGRGGAQMYVYDIDGDGDNDVVSSYNAHGYGLFWFEQVKKAGKLTFKKHRIMGELPRQNRYGVAIGNLHAIDLVDMDGDGLRDIVTGNRYWAHSGRDKADLGKAPVYWFQLVRSAAGEGAHFVPHEIDPHSGVGTQVVAGDVTGDGIPDVVVGNKMGTFVFTHEIRKVARTKWYEKRREFLKAAAARREGGVIDRSKGRLPVSKDGRDLNTNFETGELGGWTATGNAFAKHPIKGDTVNPRRSDSKSEHAGEYWVGTYEPGQSDKSTGTLTSVNFEVTQRYASYLIGGGRTGKTRVELVRADTGEVIHTSRGKNKENLHPESVDLKKYVGKQIFIRLVDESKGPWGHINFDDFLLHAKDPWSRTGGKSSKADPKANAGYSPSEAAGRMQVPEGFKAELVVGEPDLHQPIALCTDAKGRLWVAEAHSYPVRKKGDKAKDQILVFEDSNGDGAYDKRTVFADDLNLVSGLAVGHGGVWVGAAPYFMFIPDANRDLVPDGEAQILLDGWGYQDTHETLNAFIWGPDGWLYGCHGVFTHSKVGKPGTKDEDRVKVNAAVWRYHPKRHEFDVFARGASNQWGVDFDDNGQAIITACVIPHLYHVVQGARYHRQGGKHFNRYIYDDIKTIADHLHYLGSKPHAGNGVSDSVGGGHAHCGAMIYLGGAFPQQYRNVVFMNNVHGNRINTDILQRDGSGFIGTHGQDFLNANDKWFRGINMQYGPDGSVFLIDWYDEQACHLRNPKVWDRSNGRLYKVSYGDPEPVTVDVATMSNAQLVELQSHDNDWFVRTARRVLQQRGGDQAVWAGLRELLLSQAQVRQRLRALWTLHVTEGLTEGLALQVLESKAEYLRAWTIQLVTENRSVSQAIAGKLVTMAKEDPSPVVRLYLCSAAQRVNDSLRWALVEGLVGHGEDEEDHNLPLMVWYACEPLIVKDPARARNLITLCKLDKVRQFIYRRLADDQAGRQILMSLLAKNDNDLVTRDIIGELVHVLEKHETIESPKGWENLYPGLRTSRLSVVRENAQNLAVIFGDRQVLPEIRGILSDRKATLKRREWALKILVRVKDPACVGLLQDLLGDVGMQRQVIDALGKFDDAKTPGLLLGSYKEFGGAERLAAVNTLVSRASFARQLLEAVIGKSIPNTALHSATTRRQIAGLKDANVDALMTRAWGRSQPTGASKLEEIQKHKKVLTDKTLAKADLSAGRAVYAKTCMVCHKLFGAGSDIGPDITGSNRADLDYLLSNIIDPSSEVAREYMLTVVETKDGGFFSGLLAEENDSTIRLRTVTGAVEQIARKDIANGDDGKPAITTMPTSMMPEGQLLALAQDEVRDLVAYLQNPKQVPMAATKLSLVHFFNGKDLSAWDADPAVWLVEHGEIVGRTTTGLKKNNFAKSHLTFGDFRLVVDVKLIGNQGNSGIQFRSSVLDGGAMKGYQADIGKSWWGKLYHEHGRGQLANENRDKLVKHGEWNSYEILAVGHRIQTALNGQVCVDLDDPKGELRGILGVQVHSGGATEVRFRNFRLELDPEPELKTTKK
ncbi:MAG: PVC-type heme-binding CxxCH protein [Planctomycetota bacterium]|nr:PVC-type heme-binding CxxCH protein [Planctomycetota bacterium]